MPAFSRLDPVRLIASIALCQAAGAVGGFVTARSVRTWYVHLEKSSLNPPPWVFGPVWTILYTLMGISLYRAWMASRPGEAQPDDEDPEHAAAAPFFPFGVQLALNASWSLVFFGLRQPFGALVTLVALLASILATIRAFARVDRWAARLLLPYAAWVVFAGYLNASVWWLNRD